MQVLGHHEVDPRRMSPAVDCIAPPRPKAPALRSVPRKISNTDCFHVRQAQAHGVLGAPRVCRPLAGRQHWHTVLRPQSSHQVDSTTIFDVANHRILDLRWHGFADKVLADTVFRAEDIDVDNVVVVRELLQFNAKLQGCVCADDTELGRRKVCHACASGSTT